MTKKKDEKATKENAVELEESELDNVTGGAGTPILKIDGVDGESRKAPRSIPSSGSMTASTSIT